MRPLFEKVTVPEGASWALLDRRLADGIPFEWHYHPEFELTLTLNSRGQRFIGDSLAAYDDGDLALLGPNLPHTWCSSEAIDPSQPHHAVVMWFSEAWAAGITGQLAEMRAVRPLLAEAGRGVVFSREAAAAARPIIEAIPERPPADRLLRLMEVLALLATDGDRAPIAGPGSDRLSVASPDQPRVERVLDHIHAHYRERIAVAALAEVAADALNRTVVLHGDGLNLELLEEANVRHMDAVLALTDDDKTNILACVRAKNEGAQLVIALVNDASLISLIAPMGIDAYVNPRSTTVSSILRYVRHGRVKAVYSIGDAEAEVIEVQVLGTSAITGKTVRNSDLPEGCLIGLMRKGEKILVPRGDTRIEEGDVLTLFCMREQVNEVERLFQVGLDFF